MLSDILIFPIDIWVYYLLNIRAQTERCRTNILLHETQSTKNSPRLSPSVLTPSIRHFLHVAIRAEAGAEVGVGTWSGRSLRAEEALLAVRHATVGWR